MNKKVFSLIYFIYLIYSIILIFLGTFKIGINKLFLFIFISFIMYVFYKNREKQKFIFNKKIIIILIIIAILSRVCLLLLSYIDISVVGDDYSTFYNNAVAICNNQPINKLYISAFPYLYPYMLLLGYFFKLLGTNYYNVIILNIIFDLMGSYFCYKLILNLTNKKNSIISLLIWLFNPFSYIWITICCPLIITNSLMIIDFYLFNLIIKGNNKTKILLSIVLGIFLAINNSFRPIMIIFLIAIFIYYVYLVIKDKKLFIYLYSFILIFLLFNISGLIINKQISNIVNYNVSNHSGWSIYVGSNEKYNGMWNLEDNNIFNEKIYSSEYTPDNFHNYFLQEGINRYKNNGISNIKLIINKSYYLTNPFPEYSYNEFMININNEINFKKIIKIICYSFWFLILILNIISFYRMFKYKNDKIMPYILFSMGLFFATLIVEISPRYFFPIMVPLICSASTLFYSKNNT